MGVLRVLHQKEEAMTPGDWRQSPRSERWVLDYAENPVAYCEGQKRAANAAGIAAARNHFRALLDVAEAADELRLYEPGRKGDAAARCRLFDALARLESAEDPA